MMASDQIRYLRHDDIDKIKWDECVQNAAHGLIYAQSLYLDAMAGKWEALVLNDYDAVMPLTWNRKYGLYYLYQPYFIPSLGVIGLKNNGPKTSDFLEAIPGKFKYWDIKLNESNTPPLGNAGLTLAVNNRINYHLNLDRHYGEIHAGYKRLCARMIRRATDAAITIDNSGKPGDVIEFYQKLYREKHVRITAAVYDRLLLAANHYYDLGNAKVYLAKLPGGEVVAAYLVLVDNKFVYSLIGGSSEAGKESGSFYLLTDAAIKDHAYTKRTFRFEGSDIKGIAFFDSQFNPDAINYLQIIRNSLPFPLNFFK